MFTHSGLNRSHKILSRSVFLAAAAALAVTAGASAAASARSQVTLSNNSKIVSVLPDRAFLNVPNPVKFPTPVYNVFDTAHPNALYWCCNGYTVSGPTSILGAAYGVAVQFNSPTTHTFKKVTAAVGYISGNNSVTFAIYADSGNTPGAMIATGTATTSTLFGNCCGTVTANIYPRPASAPGTYWVAITTTGSNFQAANMQTVDLINPGLISSSSDGGTTWGPGSQSVMTPAVEVR